MFRTWLKNNRIEDYDLSGALFPPAKDRSYWDICRREGCIKKAEEYIDYEWPVVRATDFMAYKLTGNRLPDENRLFARRHALAALLLGEVIEYKGRFLPDIVNGMLAICEETYWGMIAEIPALRTFAAAAHPGDPPPCFPDADYNFIGLSVGDTASLLAFSYYLLYDALQKYCPEILRRVEYELERRIVSSYLHHHDFWWMGYSGYRANNWNPWIISNLLSVFLLVEKRRSIQNAGISKMLYEIQAVYDTYPDDGGCEEGASYWYASVGMLFEFCEQLYLASNGAIDFFPDEKLQKLFRYPLLNYLGNGQTLAFADGGGKYETYYATVFYRYGKYIENETYTSFARELCPSLISDPQKAPIPHMGQVRNTLFLLHDLTEFHTIGAYTPENGAFLLAQLQQAYVHSGDWFYALKGGSNGEHHCHNAVGNFVLMHDGKPLLIDTGSGTYSAKNFGPQRHEIWYIRSEWHNLPIINGQEEPFGPSFAASSMQLNGNAAAVSFAGAYPADTGLLCLNRTIEATDIFCITDEFDFSADENQICEHFVTPLDVQLQNNSVLLGNRYLLQCDSSTEVLLDAIRYEDDAGMVSKWPQGYINRIRFQCHTGKTATIRTTLTVLPGSTHFCP